MRDKHIFLIKKTSNYSLPCRVTPRTCMSLVRDAPIFRRMHATRGGMPLLMQLISDLTGRNVMLSCPTTMFLIDGTPPWCTT